MSVDISLTQVRQYALQYFGGSADRPRDLRDRRPRRRRGGDARLRARGRCPAASTTAWARTTGSSRSATATSSCSPSTTASWRPGRGFGRALLERLERGGDGLLGWAAAVDDVDARRFAPRRLEHHDRPPGDDGAARRRRRGGARALPAVLHRARPRRSPTRAAARGHRVARGRGRRRSGCGLARRRRAAGPRRRRYARRRSRSASASASCAHNRGRDVLGVCPPPAARASCSSGRSSRRSILAARRGARPARGPRASRPRWRRSTRSRSTSSSSTATRAASTRPTSAARCATTRALGDAWLLAITVAAQGRMADAALDAGADDYLHRPFTRAELIARARAGLRAAQQRSNDALLRALMVNVPGRDLPLRLARRLRAGADQRRDRAHLAATRRATSSPPSGARCSSSSTPTTATCVLRGDRRSRSRAEEPFSLEYRIVRADGDVRWVLDRGQLVPGPGGRLWLDGALFDITERRAGRGGAAAARGRGGAHARSCAPRAPASSRPPTPRGARSSATCTTARSSGSCRWRSTSRSRARRVEQGPRRRRRRSSSALGEELQEALGRAARARPRHPPRGADRARPRAGDRRARHPRAGAGRGHRASPDERLPAAIEATAYFTVAEALTNVAKYAQASARDGAPVARGRRRWSSRCATTASAAPTPRSGSGLSGLADRVGAADGDAERRQPARRGHARARRAAARMSGR